MSTRPNNLRRVGHEQPIGHLCLEVLQHRGLAPSAPRRRVTCVKLDCADESSASVGDARFAKINAHPIGGASDELSAHPCIGDGVVAHATRQVQKEFLPTAPVVEPPDL